ncbi:MAG: nucleotidyltransferase domain-containing protein [Candidatus Marsarchaeota archaeon]|jgi:predicted nucleotidyltransferase|nr:nucleotidyltransferase domain-containing protein [Candidatus Marsarchaeota archaeon]MCL5111759.1 nucleotidyltransferase domain-containing protein [Candidatus Marsarchaeota archaeon]
MRKIFPRNKNDKIIKYLLQRPLSKARVSDIARELKVNKGAVSIIVKELSRAGMLHNKQADLKNPLVRALKILINVEEIVDSGVIALLKSKAVSAGMYGSSAKGTNTEESDVDIWIRPRGSMDALDTSNLIGSISDLLGKEVQMTVLDKGRLEKLRKEDTNFYRSLVFGSILLFGDDIE